MRTYGESYRVVHGVATKIGSAATPGAGAWILASTLALAGCPMEGVNGTGATEADDPSTGGPSSPGSTGTGDDSENPSPTSTATTDPLTSTATTIEGDATGDMTGDTTGDTTGAGCPPGSEGCPCDGAVCDGDGVCSEGLCVPPMPTFCGDGVLQSGEVCDDGDALDDACSASCEVHEVLAVAHGRDFACAIVTGGLVKCWGGNAHGQLGRGDTIDRGDGPGEMGSDLSPVDLGVGEAAVAISASYSHTCAVLASGRVKCWGNNEGAALGLPGPNDARGDEPGEMGDALPAVDLGEGAVATAVATGRAFSCALLAGGRVKCWGSNNVGQLGLGDTLSRGGDPGEMGDALPFVDLGLGVVAIALDSGEHHSCALLKAGAVKCWGSNEYGQLGLGDVAPRGDGPGEMGDQLPVAGVLIPMVALTVGDRHNCALDGQGSVRCWGYGYALGIGNPQHRGDDPNELGSTLPNVNLGAGRYASAIDAGGLHTCALLVDGDLKCWGENASGELGLGDTKPRGVAPGEMGDDLPAVDLGPTLEIAALGRGGTWTESSCVVLTDGATKCWGSNSSGKLGLGDVSVARGDEPGEMSDALPRVRLFSDIW